MARLPSVEVRGTISPERPRGRVDGSAIAEGAERFARTVGAGNEAMARAMGNVGDAYSRATARQAELGQAVIDAGVREGAAIARSGEDAARALSRAGMQQAGAVETVGTQAGRTIAEAGRTFGGAVSRGGQEMAAAQAKGGEAFARGMRDVGEGLNKLGIGLERHADNVAQLDFARARASFLSSKVALDAQYEQDRDYGTLQERYSKDLGNIRDAAAESIGHPRYRERFLLESSVQAANGVANAGRFATRLETSDKLARDQAELERLRNAGLTAKPEDRPGIIAAGTDIINAQQRAGYISAEEAQRRRSGWATDYATAAVQSLPPDQQINMLRDIPKSRDDIVNRIVGVEYGDGSVYKNPKSSASGAGQFTDKTWISVVQQHRPDLLQGRTEEQVLGLRADEKLSRELVGYLVDDNEKALRAQGLLPTPGNLYLAHFLGAGGAAKVLKAEPGTPVADLVDPNAIAANRSILYGKTAESVVAWANNKMGGAVRGTGGLIDYIPADKARVIMERASTVMLRQQQQTDSEASFAQYQLNSQIRDDIASVAATGQGVGDLTYDSIRAVLGSKAALDWQNNRQDSHAVWAATQDLHTLPDDQLAARLESLRPQGGTEGFVRQQAIYSKVQERITLLRSLRSADPAGSVADDPTVKAIAPKVNPEDPSSYKPLVEARLAAQERAGVPEELQSPITKAEALEIIAPLRRMLPGQERETLREIGDTMRERYGEHADAAFAYALRVQKLDAETTKAAARVMKKLSLGDAPTVPEARAADQDRELSAANRAVNAIGMTADIGGGQTFKVTADGIEPSAAPAAPEPAPAKPIPPAADIRALLADPSKAGRFDEKYGSGASKKLLDTYKVR